uniref:uncharacterized protein isoform X2 n=1 Tax=Myxine glutinosa TaxID=7769 RepID=UPI00358EC9F0
MDELLIGEVSKHPSLFDPRNKYYNDSTRRKNVWKTVSKAVDLPAGICQKRWKNIRDAFLKSRRLLQSQGQRNAKQLKPYRLAEQLAFLMPTIERRQWSDLDSKCNEADIDEGDSTEHDDGGDADEDAMESSASPGEMSPVPENETRHLSTSLCTHALLQDSTVSKHRRLCRPHHSNVDGILELLAERSRERDDEGESRRQELERAFDEYQRRMRSQKKENADDDMDQFFLALSRIAKRFTPYWQAQVRMQLHQVVLNAEMQQLASTSQNPSVVNPSLTGPLPTQNRDSDGVTANRSEQVLELGHVQLLQLELPQCKLSVFR